MNPIVSHSHDARTDAVVSAEQTGAVPVARPRQTRRAAKDDVAPGRRTKKASSPPGRRPAAGFVSPRGSTGTGTVSPRPSRSTASSVNSASRRARRSRPSGRAGTRCAPVSARCRPVPDIRSLTTRPGIFSRSVTTS